MLTVLLGLAVFPEIRAEEAPEDGQWLMPAKNYSSTRFSGLNEITTETVKSLKVAWTFSTGINRGHEAAPVHAAEEIVRDQQV